MGGERVAIHTNFQHKKCNKRYSGCNADLISELPDHILVDIISFLSLKDAAQTSVLSSRWKNLWKHSPCLDFNADTLVVKVTAADPWKESIRIESPKYVEWVNAVIKSHTSPKLKLFKIHFDLNGRFANEITRWVEFAFSRHVERLELDLRHFGFLSGYYCFPDPEVQPLLNLANCKSLKALSFNSVHVTDEAIEFFLRNCPRLEQVTVVCSKKFSELKVCGPSLVLKHLEIRHCLDLKSIKVSATRLASLTVSNTEGLLLENVPELVSVSVTSHCVKSLISALSCCFSRLELLCVSFSGSEIQQQLLEIEETSELCNFPQMPKLKKLFIRYYSHGNASLIGLAALMKAAPHLEELVLENDWFLLWRKDGQVRDPRIKFRHHNVKVFKFSCNCRQTSDALGDLVVGVLENCVVLEKIVVDPSGGYFSGEEEELNTMRRNARQLLKPLVPRHIELVFL